MPGNVTAPPPLLKKRVKAALVDWHKPNTGKSPLENLSLFRELLNESKLNHRRLTNELLIEGIRRLEQEQSNCAAYLKERYLDEMSVVAISQMRNLSQSVIFELQKLSIEWLTAVIWDIEREKRDAHRVKMKNRLEAPTYLSLIGIREHEDHLIQQIVSPGGPYIVSLTGMGGMGKTALADSTMRRIIEERHIGDIGWVTARQQQLSLTAEINSVSPFQPSAYSTEMIVRELCLQIMPDFPLPTNFSLKDATNALKNYLDKYPHCIVVDNLETVEDIRQLMPLLQKLANPSRFLVTSREGLYGHPNLYHYSMPQLSERNALALVRQEAKQQNLASIEERGDEALRAIYETVGGNPLALRLVVGLAHYNFIDDVLLDLKEAHNETAEQLYTYIYRQAWDRLNEREKAIFLTMSVIQVGGDTLDIVAENSGLSGREARASMKTLRDLNLVNVQREEKVTYYSIHSLTRSFLLEQVLLWMGEEAVLQKTLNGVTPNNNKNTSNR